MDVYEATRIVFSRIQNLDPENASKIMGLLLIQDHGEKEMIRLAFGPENLVHSLILKARKDLGISRQNSLSSSPSSRLGLNLPPPFSPRNLSSAAPPPWTAAAMAAEAQNPDEQFGSALSPSSLPFYGSTAGATDMADEFQLSFLDDNLSSSASPTAAGYGAGAGWGGEVRRSCSVSDVCLGSDDLNSGFGWKPCLYFARGYCKNGTACRFLHGETAAMVGSDCAGGGGSSPSKMDMADLQCHELLRSKSAFPYYSPKTMNFLLQQNESQRLAANLLRSQRSEFSVNPASRQIYLTFPADSTFREEDVSNYFSIYGPVQDVRIPYQQKRMFGFVTFVYPETVKLILAKGNPHFVCDARVLVKPYKEKGKVPDKKERPDFSPSATAAGLDYDVQLGPRMFYDGSQDMVYRRKLEERADLQQALELQSRRLMDLQLLDVNKHHHHHRALSNGSPIPSPTHSPSLFSKNLVLPPFHSSPEENCSCPVPAVSVTSADQQKSPKEFSGAEKNGNGQGSPQHEIDNLQQSLEHNLPDSPFASPKASREYFSALSNATGEAEKDATVSAFSSATAASLLPANPTLDMASFKSFNCQMPRFSGAIGMYAGTGGPTCPVGI